MPTDKQWTVGAAVFMAGLAIVQGVFGAGGLLSDTRGGIEQLREGQKSTDRRIDALTEKLDRVPRQDQLNELDKANARQDGRFDGIVNEYNRRIGQLEEDRGALKAQVTGLAAEVYRRKQ